MTGRLAKSWMLLACLVLPGCEPKVGINVGFGGGSLEPRTVWREPGGAKIGLIDLRGIIADAREPGLLGAGENPVDHVAAALALAEKDRAVRAVLLRISSPGGTVAGSDEMYREIRRFRERTGKPVVASMGEVAASGGYYVALSADHLVAQPTSITGSIGVIIPTINLSQGLSRLGVESRSVKSGRNKDLANPLEPMRDAQYEVLQAMVDDFYARFRGLVAERRRGKIDESRMDELADGRIFTGAQAHELGLVDEEGGLRDAFEAAKRLAGLDHATLVKYASEAREKIQSPYALAPASPNAIQLTLPLWPAPGMHAPGETSGFYYLWSPGL